MVQLENEMACRTEGYKLPYDWYWTPAMVHLGTYPSMNISQQPKLTVGAVTAAVMHRVMNYYIQSTPHAASPAMKLLQFLILALNNSLLSVHTICS